VHPVAGAVCSGDLAQAEVGNPGAEGVADGGGKQLFPGLRGAHTQCTIRYMYHSVHKEGEMARLHLEAEGVTQTAPEAVRELVAGARRYHEWGPWSTSGYQRRGDQAADGVARTHAAERCANAAVHTFSYVPDLTDPKVTQMTTTSAGLAATLCLEMAAAWRAEVTAPGDPGCDEAPRPWSQRC